MHPEIEEYKLYYAQALYKACLYQEAMKVACQIDNPARQGEVHFILIIQFDLIRVMHYLIDILYDLGELEYWSCNRVLCLFRFSTAIFLGIH